MRRAMRWGDNDRYFGPFTFANDPKYKHYAVILKSAGDEGESYASLRLSFGGRTVIVTLPPIVRPWKRRVKAESWDPATIERLGRDWYWDVHPREYGFSYGDGFLQVKHGRSTHDSSTNQSWGYFVPWTQWRHVRHSFFGLQGEHLYDEPVGGWGKLGGEEWHKRWDEQKAREDSVPTAKFSFKDFDGEDLVATTKIEEREWRFGTGYFKWLSLFRRPKISRSLDLRFSGEVGTEKGSWKGGTIGHSIEMLPGELHEAAFRRYCEQEHRAKGRKYRLTFVGASSLLGRDGA